MATEKSVDTSRKTSKKSSSKKTASKKTASKKTASKKTASKKMASKKSTDKKNRRAATTKQAGNSPSLQKIDPEHRRRMIAETALF